MKRYISEAVGTFIFIFFGFIVLILSNENIVLTAFGFGVTLFFIYFLFARTSGAHCNPAVSLGSWITGQLSTHDIPVYLIAQFVGGIAAVGALFFLFDVESFGLLVHDISTLYAFGIETILTFILTFVYIILAQKSSKLFLNAGIIGITYILLHIVGFSYTGAGINPVRVIVPVIFSPDASASSVLWIYVIGGLFGGVIAGIMAKCAMCKR